MSSGEEQSIYVFMLITILILFPFTWIRTLERFRVGFMISGAIILVMLVTISTFDIIMIEDQNGEAGPGWVAANEDHFWLMVGLCFTLFNANPLPVLEATADKDSYTFLLITAAGTLCMIQITFSELCYYAWGENIVEPLVIQ